MNTRRLNIVRKFFITLCMLFVLLFIVSCSVEPQKPPDIQGDGYEYTKEWITWYITSELMKKANVPSVVVALVDDQDVVMQEVFGYANLEEEIPASLDTVYKMASISKPFTALAIMKLYEDGILDIDAPITDYLPDFSMRSRFPDSDPITIHSIMTHRSGLPRSSHRFLGETKLESFERASLEEIVDFLKDEYVAMPVGYRHQYSNLAFTVLGRILEVMTESEFANFMQENILNSIGMNNSSFLSSPEIEAKIATGYYINEGIAEPQSQFDYSDLPAANLYSTLRDMVTFLMFLFNEGQVDDNQLIKNETLEMMYIDSYSKPRDPTKWGLSWMLQNLSTGQLTVYHGGNVPGFTTLVGYLPNEKIGFVILANTSGAAVPSFGDKTLELMLETKFGIKPLEDDMPKPVQVDKTILENYTGKYSTGQIIEISLKNGMLQYTLQPGVKVNLVPMSETKFRLPTLIENLTGLHYTTEFFVGDEGEEDIMILKDNFGFYYTCKKIPVVEEIPPLWYELTGKYTLETSFSSEVIGKAEVKIVDNVLLREVTYDIEKVVNAYVLNPISETEILKVGGNNGGETIFYDSDTGYLRWSGIIAKPVEQDGNMVQIKSKKIPEILGNSTPW